MQHLATLGSAAAEEGVDLPLPLPELLALYELPQTAAGNTATAVTAATAATVAAAAAAAGLAPLLAVRAALEADLGPVAAARVPDLSRAAGRWGLDLAVHTCVPRPPRQWLAQLLELAPLCG